MLDKFKDNRVEPLNQDELAVFSSELMDDFQMLETYAGDVNGVCNKYGFCVKMFCGPNCVFKAWFNCGPTPTPTPTPTQIPTTKG